MTIFELNDIFVKMKLFFFIILVGIQFSGISQTKITGTLVATPRACYFIPNRSFLKSDSSILMSALVNDTIIHTSIGGNKVVKSLMDSISIQYNWAENNEEDYIKPEKLYYRDIYVVFDLKNMLPASDSVVNTHLIYWKGKLLYIKSRFKWVAKWNYLD